MLAAVHFLQWVIHFARFAQASLEQLLLSPSNHAERFEAGGVYIDSPLVPPRTLNPEQALNPKP